MGFTITPICDNCDSETTAAVKKDRLRYRVKLVIELDESTGERRIVHNNSEYKLFCDAECFLEYLKDQLEPHDPFIAACLKKGV